MTLIDQRCFSVRAHHAANGWWVLHYRDLPGVTTLITDRAYAEQAAIEQLAGSLGLIAGSFDVLIDFDPI